ncbi:MAG: TonB-dependent receptor [Gemmatimonadaceae bacterium]
MARRAAVVVATIVAAAMALPLAAQSMGAVTGRVTDAATGEPLANATVRLVGTTIGGFTRSDGSYRLPVGAGTYDVRANIIGYAMSRDSIVVTAGGTVTKDFALTRTGINLDEIAIVGSRAADRTVVQAPVPIDVLSAAEIQATGLTETSQIIQMLAPSFNFPRPSVTDGTDHIRPATLRGLGPDQVLVLVNGKRRHQTALVHVNGSVGRGSTSVDLNAIPASAIDRIEILRDGAAAQYGSDAIAGVMNIILKSEPGGSISSSFGQAYSKVFGGDTRPGGGKFRDGQVTQVAANVGGAIRGNGFVHLSGEFRDREGTNRARVDTTSTLCRLGSGASATTIAGCTLPPTSVNRFDERFNQSWQGDSDTRDWSFFLNSALPLQSGVQLYGFGGLSLRDGTSAGFYRIPSDRRTVRAVTPNGFLPQINSDITDISGTVGAKGTLRGWGWDLSAIYGGNAFEFTIDNTVNVSLGTATPREFYAGALRSNQLATNLDIVRAFPSSPLGDLNVAIGAEFRRDGYKIERGDPTSYQVGTVTILDGPEAGRPAPPYSQVFPGFRPVDEVDTDRTNVAGYVDVEITPFERLLIAVAGRAEDYSDFGSTVDGKIAARFELFKGVALRAAAQDGFRAPSLPQSYFSAVSTNFVVVNGVNTPFDVRTFPVGSQGGQLLGAQPLRPEKSVNLSGGLTFSPIANLSLTADYYRVNIDDRIVLSGNFIHASVRSLLEANNILGVSGARYFTNAIDTRTKGLDVVLNYGLNLGGSGLVRFTGGYNRNKTKVLSVIPTPSQLSAVSSSLFDRGERARIEIGQPRNTVSLTGNYTVKGLGVNVHTQRFGQVTNRNSTNATGVLDQTFAAKWISDASVSYKLLNRLTLAVGANNIFDVYPDTNITANQTRGIYLFTGASPFGFNGRYIFARASYDFANLGGLLGRKTELAAVAPDNRRRYAKQD